MNWVSQSGHHKLGQFCQGNVLHNLCEYELGQLYIYFQRCVYMPCSHKWNPLSAFCQMKCLHDSFGVRVICLESSGKVSAAFSSSI